MEVSPCRFSWTDEGSCLTVTSFPYFENRAKFRREANQADNKAATVAVDSLINFEAVKVRKSLAAPSHSG
jgi:ABC-type transport system involved in Fe-S cluster assembly fused permease/ATPase subunit